MLASVNQLLQIVAIGVLSIFRPPYRWKNYLREISFVGSESFLVVIICVSFAAIVTIIEASYHMTLVVQSDAMVPGFASLLIIRELGSVITALLIGSRVGAGWAAEVASMKISEQIDALKLLRIDPIKYLVSPKIVGSVLGTLLLGLAANIICLICAMFVTKLKLGYPMPTFISMTKLFVEVQDLVFASLKLMTFGFVVPIIACFYGFRAKSGAEGVGSATTQAVVSISVAIIFLDFVLSYVFSHFY
tara:strand:- start:1046 stop:1786 length:741 start_codon:yes stop_codon:yes gene_type:complete